MGLTFGLSNPYSSELSGLQKIQQNGLSHCRDMGQVSKIHFSGPYTLFSKSSSFCIAVLRFHFKKCSLLMKMVKDYQFNLFLTL